MTFAAPSAALAAIPSTLGYQGRLKNSSGTVQSGTFNFTFRLYASSTGGTALWTETQSSVTVDQGFFSVRLGQITPFPTSLDFNQELYISTEVNSDGEMSPRVAVNTVPYAYTAAGVMATSTVPTTVGGGRMYYDMLTGTLKYYDATGSVWRTLGTSASSTDLQTVTNAGSTTTNAIQFGGGTSTGPFTFQSTLSVTGATTLGNVSGTNATFTNLFVSNFTPTNLTGTNFVWTNATGTNTTSTNLYAGNATFVGATTTALSFTSASGSQLFASSIQVNGSSVCLANGTNCPASATTTIWQESAANNVAYLTTSTRDLLLGGNATASAGFIFDAQSSPGTSTVFIGAATNANLLVGTSTYGGGLASAFSVDGNDVFVQGQIGTLGGLFAPSLTITGTTPSNFTNLTWTNATGTNTTSTNLFATNLTGTNAVFTGATTTALSFTSASGSQIFASSIQVNGSNVCLANGTNCPADGEPATTATLQMITNNGATTTNIIYALGGIQTLNLTATGSVSFTGSTALATLTGTNATFTNVTTTAFNAASITVTSGTAGTWNVGNLSANNATATNLFATTENVTNITGTNATFTNLFVSNLTVSSTSPAVFTNLTWTNATGTNTTSTSLFATNFQATSGTITTLAAGSLNAAFATTTVLSFTTASGSNIFASSILVNGSAVCLANGINCPPDGEPATTATLQMITNNGATTTNIIYALGGIQALNLTATGTLNVTGQTTLGDVTGNNATFTNLFVTNLTVSSTSPAVFTNLVWTNATGTNTTSTALNATNYTGTSGTVGTWNVGNLSANNATTTNLFATTENVTNITGTNATFTNLAVTNFSPSSISAATVSTTNLIWVNATGTNTTSTNLFATNFQASTGTLATLNAGAVNVSSTLLVGGVNVCLQNGTNCPSISGGGSSPLTDNSVTNIVYLTTSTRDLLLGSNATNSAGFIFDNDVNGTSTVIIGGGTNTNLLVGTLSYGGGLDPSFVLNGNDEFIQGQLGVLGGIVTTGVTSTNLVATSGTITTLNVTTLNVGGTTPSTFTNLVWTNATGTNTTSTNLFATNLTGTNAVFTGATTTALAFTSASGSQIFASSILVNGSAVCLANGINCPPDGEPATTATLQMITNNGASTTNIIYALGGIQTLNLTATGTLNVTGQTTLGDVTGNNATFTSLFVSNLTVSSTSPAVFTNLVWTNATGTNTTSTALNATNYTGTSGTVGTWNVGNLNANSANFTTSILGNATATTLFSTIVSSTNLTATNATFTNISVSNFTPTNLTVTNLIWTNATGTNTTSTSLFATNFQANSSTITTLAAGSLNAAFATTTVLSFTTASGSNIFASSIQVNGSNVCLANGTNCPPDGEPATTATLQMITDNGASTTNQIYAFGGIIMASSTVTSTFTVVGTSTFGQVSAGNVTATTIFGTVVSGTNLFATNGTFTNLTINGTTPSTFQNLIWVNATGTNTTSTNLFATNLTGTNAVFTGATTTALAFTSASGSQLFTSSILVNGQAVCLQSGTNCPAGNATPTLTQVLTAGNTSTLPIYLLGGITTYTLTATGSVSFTGDTSLATLTGTNATFTNVTTTAFNASSITVTSGTAGTWNVGNLNANSANFTTSILGNATATTLFSSIASSTNLVATNATFTNISVSNFTPTNLTVTNLIWTNATGTNTTSTSLFATNFQATSGTAATYNIGTGNIATLTGTNATFSGVTTTALAFTSASGSQLFASSILVNGSAVCLANGINCPPDGEPATTATLQMITNNGASTTNIIYALGGIQTLNLTATGTLNVTGQTTLGDVTGNNATFTSLFVSNLTVSSTSPAVFTNLVWTNATGTNTTSTALNATNYTGTSGTVGTWNVGNLNANTANFTTSILGNATATTLFSTIVSSTNLTATNATFTNISVSNFTPTNLTVTNLIWTNATGTNTTSTSLFASNFQATSGTITTLNIGSGNIATLTGTNATFSGVTTTALAFTSASGSQLFASSIQVNGSAVCLANGINCPPDGEPATTATLQMITDNGASTTNQIYAFGGIIMASSTVTSTFTVVGTSTFGQVSAGNVTATTIFGTVVSGTNLFATNGTFTNLTINGTTPSTFQNLIWVNATGTNTTSTNLYVTNFQGTSGTISTLNTGTLNVSSTLLVGGVNVCLQNGTNCPSISGGGSSPLTDNSVSNIVYLTTSTRDLLLGSNATNSAGFIFDNDANGTSTVIIGGGTNTNLLVGTLSYGGGLDPSFVLNGNDEFIQGQLGVLGGIVTTGVTSTNLVATSGTITTLNVTTLNVGGTTPSTFTNLVWTNATGTNTTSTNLFATNLTGTNAVFTGATTTALSFTSASGSQLFASSILVNGSAVCLANGINCPPDGEPATTATLQMITNNGASTTNQIYAFGGIIMASSTVTSTFTVVGTSTFGQVSAGNVTATTIFGTVVSGTNLFATNGTFTNLTINGTTPSVFSNIIWTNATGTNTTSTNFFATNLQATSGTAATWNMGAGSAQTLNFAHGTSTNWFGFNTASGSQIFTSSILVNGQAVCLQSGTNCPAGNATPTLTQVLTAGNTSTLPIYLLGGITTYTLTATGSVSFTGDTSLATLTGTNATFTNVTTTAFNASSITVTSGTAGTWNVGNLNANSANFTTSILGNATATTLFSSIASSTNLVATNATFTNISVSNFTPTNLTVTNLIWTNATGTNTTSTSLFATNFQATSGTLTTANLGTATVSNNLTVGGTLTGGNATFSGVTTTALAFTSASGSQLFASSILVNGSAVCLANGINCPPDGEPATTATLQMITDNGATTTNIIYALGGIITPSSTVTSSFTVVGNTSLQNMTGVNATYTSVTTTNLFATNFQGTSGTFTTWNMGAANAQTLNFAHGTSTNWFGFNIASGTSLYANNGTFVTLTITGSAPSVFQNIIWTNATGTNTTSTNHFSTNFQATSGTAATWNMGAGSAQTLNFAHGTSTNWFGYNIASGTSIFANAATFATATIAGQSVCLSNGVGCIVGSMPTLAQVTAAGNFTTSTVFFYGGYLAASSTVTSTFTVVGTSTFGQVSAGNVTATTIFGTVVSGTNLFATNGTFTNLTINGTTPSNFTNIIWTNATGTNTTSTNLFATNFQANSSTITTLAAGTLNAALATTTILSFTTASGSNIFASSIAVNGSNVCLANGTNCPASQSPTSTIWQESTTTNIVYLTTSTRDLLVGGNTTATAGFIVDSSGGNTSTNVYFGNSTNTNVFIGTSTWSGGLKAGFNMDGNDLLVQGFIGSIGGLYSASAVKVGTASTQYGDGFLVKENGAYQVEAAGGDLTLKTTTSGNMIVNVASGSFLPSSDLSVSLGVVGQRFNGVFGNVTSTNATTTVFAFTSASGSSLLVSGQNVCLANGTNCPASSGTSTNIWQYSYTSNAISATTGTADLLVGGNTTATAGLIFDSGATGTSNVIVGGSTNTNLLVGALAYTGGLDSTFSVNGNDAYVAGMLGVSGGLYFLNGTGTNIVVTNATHTALNATNYTGTSGTVVTWNVGTLNAPTATLGNATATSFFATNSSATNMFATNGTFTNLTINGTTPSNFTNIIWTNGTGTNTTSTNLFATNFQATSGTLSTANLGNTSISGTLVISGNATATNVTSTNIFSTVVSSSNIFASAIQVNGSNVCLANGTNCPASSAAATTTLWQENNTSNIIYLTTSTRDLLVGGNTTATAGFIFDSGATGTSNVIVGGSTNTNFLVGASSYTGGLDATFSVNGNDAYVAGMLGVSGGLYFLNGTGTNLVVTGATTTALSFTTASGSTIFASSIKVNGSNVCLANGTNCLTGTASTTMWQENSTSNIIFLSTSTRDLLLGGNTTATAGLIFDSQYQDGTSTLILGASTNTNFLMGTTTYGGGLASSFKVNGNDAFIQGKLGALDGLYGAGLEVTNATMTNATATNFAFTFASGSSMAIAGSLLVNGSGACTLDGTNCPGPKTKTASSTSVVTLAASETAILTVTSTPSTVATQIWVVATEEVEALGGGTHNVFMRIRQNGCTTGTQIGPTVSIITTSNGSIVQLPISVVATPATTTATTYSLCVSRDAAGSFQSDAATLSATEVSAGADVGEVYYTFDNTLAPGEVVSLDPSLPDGVMRTTSPYDPQAIGVISTQAGSLLFQRPSNSSTYPVIVALVGRVPVKVSNENGNITQGDALTSASSSGYVMKATNPGAMIGRAMQAATSTTGTINMFVNPGYFTPSFTGSSTIDGQSVFASRFIGFGTNNPQQKLEVTGNIFSNTSGTALFISSRGSVNNYGGFQLQTNGHTDWTFGNRANGNQDFSLYDDNADRYRFYANASSGNVGINTSLPTQALEVGGNIFANTSGTSLIMNSRGANSNYAGFQFLTNGTVDYTLGTRGEGTRAFHIYDDVAGADRFYIDATSGNIGIGTTSATTALSVRGTVSSTGMMVNGSNVCLANGTNCPAGTATTTNMWQYSRTNNTIYANTSTADILLGGNTSATAGLIFDSQNTPGVSALILGFTTTTNLYVPNGSVGIGNSSPQQKLEVTGNIFANTSGTALMMTSRGTDANYAGFQFLTNGTLDWTVGTRANNDGFSIFDDIQSLTRFYVATTTGYVGIGTITPQATLDVLGTVSTTNLTVNGKNVCLSDGTNCSQGFVKTASSTASTALTGTESELLVVTSTPRNTTNTVWIVATVRVSAGAITSSATFRIRRGTSCTGGTKVGVDVTSSIATLNDSDSVSMSFVDSPATSTAVGYRLCGLVTAGTMTAVERTLTIQTVYQGADLAEVYYSSDASLAPGETVAIDPSDEGMVKRAGAYDNDALGIISTRPSLVMSDAPRSGLTPVMVALAGRVPAKVTAQNGAIHPGDALAMSSVPGRLMKATAPGMIVGRALSTFSAPTGTNANDAATVGEVMAFVQTSYFFPNASTTGLDMPGTTSTSSTTDLQGGATISDDLLNRLSNSDIAVKSLVVTGKVTVKGHAAFGADTVGQAKVQSGDTRVDITFDQGYDLPPVVTVTPMDFVETMYRVTDVGTSGFSIQLNNAVTHDLLFNWHAFEPAAEIHVRMSGSSPAPPPPADPPPADPPAGDSTSTDTGTTSTPPVDPPPSSPTDTPPVTDTSTTP